MDKYPLTKPGFDRLEAEIKDLRTVQRPEVVKEIAVAREHGDLKENAEYHAAREKQSWIEGRLQELEDKFARAEVIDVSILSGSKVKFGATVKLVDEDTEEEVTYQIVGEYEANLDEGKISITAPIARALISKEKGDSVEVQTPKGEKWYEILDVQYK